VRQGRRATHVVRRGFFLGWAGPLLLDPKGRLCAVWSHDRAFLAARSSSRGERFEQTTPQIDPPLVDSSTSNGAASTAAIAWRDGLDLFIGYEHRVVRQRFRFRSR
jgi:hypothetical protein